MTMISEAFFDKLTKRRSKIADALQDPSVSGIKDSVVDKYSDQAHFIYELLQNADDVGATKVRFILKKDSLLYLHNGTRHFSISDPDNEGIDKKNGTLGDLNAITSIGQSSKSQNNAKIGKFGVGFKAVFQYTETPEIYDPNISFRIIRMIVPEKIDKECPEREKDETCFEFPFNKSDVSPAEAYEDIRTKLISLHMPMIFLNSLENIEVYNDSFYAVYTEEVKEEHSFENGINFKKIGYSYKENYDKEGRIFEKNLFLTSKITNDGYKISVAYFIDKNNLLTAESFDAFCFFPTKVHTGLPFAIHAPFLLTDSREGIKVGKQHNLNMIDELATLAADSLDCIRDISIKNNEEYFGKNFFDIIPYDQSRYVHRDGQISFMPFYYRIKRKLETSEILPDGNNGFVTGKHAYWSEKVNFSKLITNEQLRAITGDENACWVFENIGVSAHKNYKPSIIDYIRDVVLKSYSDEQFLVQINANFIESQPIDWLLQLYKFLMSSKNLMKLAKKLPIILDREKAAVSAFDDEENFNIFLPSGDVDDDDGKYRFVCIDIIRKKEGREFLEGLGIHEPDLKDEIYKHILPQYEDGHEFDPRNHWKYFLKFYRKGSTVEIRDLVTRLSRCRFAFYYDEFGNIHNSYPSDIYKKDKDIERYFQGIKEIHFFDFDEIHNIALRTRTLDVLDNFLKEFNLDFCLPKIVEREYKKDEAIKKKLPFHNRKSIKFEEENFRWIENCIDGLQENIEKIEKDYDKDRSIFLWKILLRIYNKYFFNKNPMHVLKGTATHMNSRHSLLSSVRKEKKDFLSTDIAKIRNARWLIDYKGRFVAPSEVTVQELDSRYDVKSDIVPSFLKFLGIEEESTENLSARQKEKLSFMNELLTIVGKEKLEKLLKDAEKGNGKSISEDTLDGRKNEESSSKKEKNRTGDDIFSSDESMSKIMKEVESRALKKSVERKDRTKDNTESMNPYNQSSRNEHDFEQDSNIAVEINIPDEDEYLRAPVDYKKKIDSAKDRAASELEHIQEMEQLQEHAQETEKYSYDWFLALLDLELMSNNTESNSREITIKFGKVSKEEGTERTLLLSNPDRYIPLFMEELTNIELRMIARDEKNHRAIIEAMSVKDYTLKVKLRSIDEIRNLDLKTVKECTIKAVSPSFLLDALVEEFRKLEFPKNDNLQNNLPENIEFIFGPPGTGKTTYLSRNVIKPLMDDGNHRVLVLTPTNKAADVIARRIIEIADDTSWKDWLIRFGTTNDEYLEDCGAFKDKSLEIGKYVRCTVITTIARYPYDFFIPSNGIRLMLNRMDWDYVVVDEASMIPLANITYLLYNAKPKKYVIAGDPFQIEPITSVDLWKDENIYEMVHLKSFKNPKTVPYDYKVTNLTTQYRSIPCVGNIFSRFAYDGILEHNRNEDSCRALNIDSILPLKNLNIIKFPVSKFEGIYRAKRLSNSPYQVYVGLFVVEFTKYLAALLSRFNQDENFSIGVIAPYHAEASLIDKLLVQMDIPSNIKVHAGTIHGFQGDECDIIVCVFNPPPHISNSPQMFLNKKNIINIAISRAKDYLIIVMPNNNTQNIGNLYQVLGVEKLFKEEKKRYLAEFTTKELEEMMFDESDYIESNTFNTNHQNVNVYGLPEYYYEVRSEDNALDIQVHKEARKINQRNGMNTDIKSAASQQRLNPNVDRDDDGWDCHELAQLIILYKKMSIEKIDIDILAKEFQEKLVAKYIDKEDTDEILEKRDMMTIGYKLSVVNQLEQGMNAESAGASWVEYELWKMYKNDFERFSKLL